MNRVLLVGSLSFSLVVIGCSSDDDTDNGMTAGGTKTVSVTIANISDDILVRSAGTVGEAPTPPGDSISFSFIAPQGSRFTFATMFGQSNDWFISFGDQGIALYDGQTALEGDITDSLKLWDLGTEINQPIGTGPDQAPRQSAPNTGADDTVTTVRLVETPAYQPDSVLTARIEKSGDNQFTVTLTVLSTSVTPISPLVWTVFSSGMPLFEAGAQDRGDGMEALAEDGNPSEIGAYLQSVSGVTTPLSPGIWAVTGMDTLLFKVGSPASMALEALAEDGDPSVFDSILQAQGVQSATFATAPIAPGENVSFTATLSEGQQLYFATMFVQSNDAFFSPDENGLVLWPAGGTLTTGDITDSVKLWDAGTEVNEIPGVGANQAPRQAAPNTGPDENGTVQLLDDGYNYGAVDKLIKVTVSEVQ